MMYGTPKRILTDQGRNFESSYFQNFCNFFRINKIRTSGYRSQANGICERFNQSLLVILRKILNKNQISDWDRYINFATHAYNTSVHSSTGFTPFYLTFGSEARTPPEISFGFQVSANSKVATDQSQGNFSNSIFEYFSLLNDSFQCVRDNLKTFHRREKERYDLGSAERIFHVGDIVRIRIKTRQHVPLKFKAE